MPRSKWISNRGRSPLICRFLPVIGKNDTYEDGPRGMLAVCFDEEMGKHYARPSSFSEYAEATQGEERETWRK